jgi:hypothetical protein
MTYLSRDDTLLISEIRLQEGVKRKKPIKSSKKRQNHLKFDKILKYRQINTKTHQLSLKSQPPCKIIPTQRKSNKIHQNTIK